MRNRRHGNGMLAIYLKMSVGAKKLSVNGWWGNLRCHVPKTFFGCCEDTTMERGKTSEV